MAGLDYLTLEELRLLIRGEREARLPQKPLDTSVPSYMGGWRQRAEPLWMVRLRKEILPKVQRLQAAGVPPEEWVKEEIKLTPLERLGQATMATRGLLKGLPFVEPVAAGWVSPSWSVRSFIQPLSPIWLPLDVAAAGAREIIELRKKPPTPLGVTAPSVGRHYLRSLAGIFSPEETLPTAPGRQLEALFEIGGTLKYGFPALPVAGRTIVARSTPIVLSSERISGKLTIATRKIAQTKLFSRLLQGMDDAMIRAERFAEKPGFLRVRKLPAFLMKTYTDPRTYGRAIFEGPLMAASYVSTGTPEKLHARSYMEALGREAGAFSLIELGLAGPARAIEPYYPTIIGVAEKALRKVKLLPPIEVSIARQMLKDVPLDSKARAEKVKALAPLIKVLLTRQTQQKEFYRSIVMYHSFLKHLDKVTVNPIEQLAYGGKPEAIRFLLDNWDTFKNDGVPIQEFVNAFKTSASSIRELKSIAGGLLFRPKRFLKLNEAGDRVLADFGSLSEEALLTQLREALKVAQDAELATQARPTIFQPQVTPPQPEIRGSLEMLEKGPLEITDEDVKAVIEKLKEIDAVMTPSSYLDDLTESIRGLGELVVKKNLPVPMVLQTSKGRQYLAMLTWRGEEGVWKIRDLYPLDKLSDDDVVRLADMISRTKGRNRVTESYSKIEPSRQKKSLFKNFQKTHEELVSYYSKLLSENRWLVTSGEKLVNFKREPKITSRGRKEDAQYLLVPIPSDTGQYQVYVGYVPKGWSGNNAQVRIVGAVAEVSEMELDSYLSGEKVPAKIMRVFRNFIARQSVIRAISGEPTKEMPFTLSQFIPYRNMLNELSTYKKKKGIALSTIVQIRDASKDFLNWIMEKKVKGLDITPNELRARLAELRNNVLIDNEIYEMITSVAAKLHEVIPRLRQATEVAELQNRAKQEAVRFIQEINPGAKLTTAEERDISQWLEKEVPRVLEQYMHIVETARSALLSLEELQQKGALEEVAQESISGIGFLLREVLTDDVIESYGGVLKRVLTNDSLRQLIADFGIGEKGRVDNAVLEQFGERLLEKINSIPLRDPKTGSINSNVVVNIFGTQKEMPTDAVYEMKRKMLTLLKDNRFEEMTANMSQEEASLALRQELFAVLGGMETEAVHYASWMLSLIPDGETKNTIQKAFNDFRSYRAKYNKALDSIRRKVERSLRTRLKRADSQGWELEQRKQSLRKLKIDMQRELESKELPPIPSAQTLVDLLALLPEESEAYLNVRSNVASITRKLVPELSAFLREFDDVVKRWGTIHKEATAATLASRIVYLTDGLDVSPDEISAALSGLEIATLPKLNINALSAAVKSGQVFVDDVPRIEAEAPINNLDDLLDQMLANNIAPVELSVPRNRNLAVITSSPEIESADIQRLRNSINARLAERILPDVPPVTTELPLESLRASEVETGENVILRTAFREEDIPYVTGPDSVIIESARKADAEGKLLNIDDLLVSREAQGDAPQLFSKVIEMIDDGRALMTEKGLLVPISKRLTEPVSSRTITSPPARPPTTPTSGGAGGGGGPGETLRVLHDSLPDDNAAKDWLAQVISIGDWIDEESLITLITRGEMGKALGVMHPSNVIGKIVREAGLTGRKLKPVEVIARVADALASTFSSYSSNLGMVASSLKNALPDTALKLQGASIALEAISPHIPLFQQTLVDTLLEKSGVAEAFEIVGLKPKEMADFSKLIVDTIVEPLTADMSYAQSPLSKEAKDLAVTTARRLTKVFRDTYSALMEYNLRADIKELLFDVAQAHGLLTDADGIGTANELISRTLGELNLYSFLRRRPYSEKISAITSAAGRITELANGNMTLSLDWQRKLLELSNMSQLLEAKNIENYFPIVYDADKLQAFKEAIALAETKFPNDLRFSTDIKKLENALVQSVRDAGYDEKVIRPLRSIINTLSDKEKYHVFSVMRSLDIGENLGDSLAQYLEAQKVAGGEGIFGVLRQVLESLEHTVVSPDHTRRRLFALWDLAIKDVPLVLREYAEGLGKQFIKRHFFGANGVRIMSTVKNAIRTLENRGMDAPANNLRAVARGMERDLFQGLSANLHTNWLIRGVSNLEIPLKLGLAGPLNMVQLINSIAYSGTGNTLRVALKYASIPKYRKAVQRLVAQTAVVNDLMYKEMTVGTMSQLAKWSLQVSGFNTLNYWSRALSSAAHIENATRMLRDYAKTKNPVLYERLHYRGFTDNEIKNWASLPQLERQNAIHRTFTMASTRTQFVPTRETLPGFWNYPILRLPLQFKQFALFQAKFLRSVLWEQNERIASVNGRLAIASHLVDVAKILGLAIPAGEAYIYLTNWLKGIPGRERTRLDEAMDIIAMHGWQSGYYLYQEGILERIAERILGDIGRTGQMAIAWDAVEAMRSPSGVESFIIGPAYTDIAYMLGGAVQTEEKEYGRQLSVRSPLRRIITRLMPNPVSSLIRNVGWYVAPAISKREDIPLRTMRLYREDVERMYVEIASGNKSEELRKRWNETVQRIAADKHPVSAAVLDSIERDPLIKIRILRKLYRKEQDPHRRYHIKQQVLAIIREAKARAEQKEKREYLGGKAA